MKNSRTIESICIIIFVLLFCKLAFSQTSNVIEFQAPVETDIKKETSLNSNSCTLEPAAENKTTSLAFIRNNSAIKTSETAQCYRNNEDKEKSINTNNENTIELIALTSDKIAEENTVCSLTEKSLK